MAKLYVPRVVLGSLCPQQVRADRESLQAAQLCDRADFFQSSLYLLSEMKSILALCMLVGLCLANCPANYNIDNLKVDHITFTIDSGSSSSSQNFNYTFAHSFAVEPSVAIAVQDFSLNTMGPLGFAIYPMSTSKEAVSFRYMHSPQKWAGIRINFWVSANPQIQLGYFRIDSIAPSNNMAYGSTSIKQAFPSGTSPVIRTYINGFDSVNGVLQLATAPTNLQGTNLTIGISVGPESRVRTLWGSFIAFSPSTASFTSYGGQIKRKEFSGSIATDISNTIYRSPYTLLGLNLISLKEISSIDFSTELSDAFNCVVSASRTVQDFSMVYIVIGVPVAQICACGSGLAAHESTCVSSCPSGYGKKVYGDGGLACMKGVASITTTTVKEETKTTRGSVPDSMQQTQQQSSTHINTQPAITTTQPSSSATATSSSSNSNEVKCIENAYFNGVECKCEVGYAYVLGKCQAHNVHTTSHLNHSSTNSSTSGSGSSSGSGSTSGSSSSGSTDTGSQPTLPAPCPTGYVRVNGNCVFNTPTSCPINAHDNGLGTCVCNDGYFLENNMCVMGAPCQANSQRNSQGKCVCNQGFNEYDGVCSQCPLGALWSSSSSRCIYVCGQNSAFSENAGKCVCNPGFGIINKACQQCPANHFISQGYCVTCPLNAHYQSQYKRCECKEGYFLDQMGSCVPKCGTNQVYDHSSQQCRCLGGLGRVNGACQICPSGSRPNSNGESCHFCKVNEQLRNGECVCEAGYATNSAGVCTACSNLSNAFIINGVCAKCPGGKVHDGRSGCACAAGKVEQGGLCIAQCKNDELIDSNGNCYSCSLNQIVSNGQCVCKSGYRMSSCGVCQLSCSSTQFYFQGGCASCPLNTLYSEQTKGCICPSGFYKNAYGVCEKLILRPIDCQAGEYFDENEGCKACTGDCKTCSSANVCLSCNTQGYEATSQGQCVPNCGDGIVIGSETCDSGSSSSPGCISCQVTSGWTCSGQPSQCQQIPVSPPTTVPNNPATGPSLSLVGTPNINANNVFVTLRTNPTFNFANPTEMQSFIKATFSSGPKPTMYCSQRENPNLDLFDCLLIYPSGVPNSDFNVGFSYDHQNLRASTTVNVDPVTAVNSRSNSRRQR